MKYLSVLFAMLSLSAGELQWHTNYSEAKAKAQSENKPMFLLFTGTDWCVWCQRLESEVLNTSEFADKAGEKFVFVFVDFPAFKEQSTEEKAQNETLKNKHKIKGFPTVLILNPNEKVVDTAGYRPGGPEGYADFILNKIK